MNSHEHDEPMEVDDSLSDELRRRAITPPYPEAEIEARIHASIADGVRPGRRQALTTRTHLFRSRAARVALTAAASLVLFIGGAEYGRRTAPISIVVPAPATPVEIRNDLPYSIQSAGSQYVATLATFSGQADSLSTEERRIAREVALAALYSASVELLREAGDDEMLRAVTEMVARRRNTMGRSTIDGGMRF
jgi:hypothetical protein